MKTQYEQELNQRLIDHVNEGKKEDRKKYFIFFKKLLLLIALLFIAGFLKYWAQYSAPWMEYQEEVKDYTRSNVTQVFENINLSNNEVYQVGFYFNNSDYVRKHWTQLSLDGNYTLEYYEDGKLLRTLQFNKNYATLGFSSSQSHFHRAPFDQIKVPQDMTGKKLTIKLTVHQPLGFLKMLKQNNEKVYFFIYRVPREDVQTFERWKREEKDETLPRSYFATPFEVYDLNSSHIPLLNALLAKDFKTIKQIIEEDNGIDVNTSLGNIETDIIVARKPQNRTALMYAASMNDVKTLKYLIKKGADLNRKDYQRQNALGYAIQNDHVEAAEMLLNAGAKLEDVDYVTIKGTQQVSSPLIAAVGSNSYKMTKFLLEHGARHIYPSDTITHDVPDAYSYLNRIDDYKRILKLLIDYNVSSICKGSKPDDKQLHETYYGCTIGGLSSDICAPITDRNLSEEQMDIFVEYEIRYIGRKFQESPEQRKKIQEILNQSRKEN